MKSITISNLITNRDNLSFKQYLREVSKIECFKGSEEVECSIKAFNGDDKAKEELVVRNLKFVISVAKQYVTSQTHLEDLVNEGNIGLIMAANRFNPNNKVKFISYAVWWVRKLIVEHINKNNRMVRLPSNRINSLAKLDKLIKEKEQEKGYSIDVRELNEEFTSEEFEFLDILSSYRMDSLDKQLGDEDGSTLMDLISDNTFGTCDQSLNDTDYKQSITKGLDSLKTRDKEILIMLFGLDGGEPKTLQEVSDVYAISREMVRQIKNKSLLKLSKNTNMKLAYTEY